jgi:hypothetical protein
MNEKKGQNQITHKLLLLFADIEGGKEDPSPRPLNSGLVVLSGQRTSADLS